MKRGNVLIPVVVLVAVGMIAVAVLAGLKLRKSDEALLKKAGPEEVGEESPAPEEMAGWEVYENDEYYLRFRYPPELEAEELAGLGPNFFQINLIDKASRRGWAIFMVKTAFEEEEAVSFVGQSPLGKVAVNSRTWDFYDFPEGYSNSPAFTVYQGEVGEILYAFKFYESVSDELRDQIMVTVEAIESI
jgi:hypothetical protein